MVERPQAVPCSSLSRLITNARFALTLHCRVIMSHAKSVQKSLALPGTHIKETTDAKLLPQPRAEGLKKLTTYCYALPLPLRACSTMARFRGFART